MIVLFWNCNEKMKISLLGFNNFQWNELTYFDDTCDFRYNACFTKCEEKRTCYFYGGFYKNRSGSNLIGNSLDRFCWNWSYEELKDIKLYNGEKIEDII
jgi:hypothetical protein